MANLTEKRSRLGDTAYEQDLIEMASGNYAPRMAVTWATGAGVPADAMPVASEALGATTDAAASSTMAEDATARTGIGLWKGIKNVLLLIKAALDSLIAPATFTNTTVTVAQSASESGELDTGGAGILMIYPPAAIEATTTNISFKVGHTAGSRYQLYDEYGVKVSIPFTVGTAIKVPADKLLGGRYVSIVCETAAGAAVAQATAAREFVFVTRRV